MHNIYNYILRFFAIHFTNETCYIHTCLIPVSVFIAAEDASVGETESEATVGMSIGINFSTKN